MELNNYTIHDTIYKQDSKGKIRTYFIEQNKADYRMVTGLLDGKQVKSKWTTAKPKNSGKTNATSGETQASKEIEARYTKKLAEHYHRKLEDAVKTKFSFFAPMLATEIAKTKFQMVDGSPILLDPKLDGMRLTNDETGYRSRKGKPVPAAAWIHDTLHEFLINNPTITLDGELYNHKYKDDFQSLMKICRRVHLTEEDKKIAQRDLEYHIYDMYDSSNPDMTALERKEFLKDSGLSLLPNIEIVKYQLISTVEEYNQAVLNNIALGYEGSIIRLIDSVYENKRTKTLLKVKSFNTTEFKLLSISAGKGNRSDIAGAVTFDCEGMIVGGGIRGSWEFCADLLKHRDKYIGGQATIRYFGLTDSKKPRFPVLIDINRPD